MRGLKRIWAIGGFFLLTGMLTASTPNADTKTGSATSLPRFVQVRLEGGMMRQSLRAITIDERGFVWLGTLNGLVRWDGGQAAVFSTDPANPSTISGNGIWALCSDTSGCIWAGTWGAGLNRIDIRTGEVERLLPESGNPDSLRDSRIRSLLVDENNRLWIGTEGWGVSIYDPGTRRFRHMDTWGENQNHRDQPVYDIMQDRKGRIWLAAANGLLRCTAESQRPEFIWPGKAKEDASSAEIHTRALAQTRDGHIWAATGKGLIELTEDGAWVRTWYADARDSRYSLQHDDLRSLLCDNKDNLWIGYLDGGGVDCLDASSRRVTRYPPSKPNDDSFPDDPVICMLQDASGLYWFGLGSRGVRILNPDRSIQHYPLPQEPYPGAPRQMGVSCVLKDSRGWLWSGTNAGLNRWNPGENRWEPIPLAGNYGFDVFDLMEDPSGRIWTATFQIGVVIVDPRSLRMLPRNGADPTIDGLKNLQALVLHRDRAGRVWLGTDGRGLACLEQDGTSISHYRHDAGDPGSLGSDVVMDVADAADGGWWVATWGGGLNHLSSDRGRFTQYRHDPDNNGSISSNIALSLALDGRGYLWVGTYGGGLNRMDLKDKSFQRFNESQGLPSDVVTGIVEDNGGQLWVSTSAGLARLDRGSGQFLAYNQRDGLLSRGFGFNAFHRDRQGRLYFGGIGGVTAFFPEAFRRSSFVPNVYFTRLDRFDSGDSVVCLPDEPSIRVGYRDSFRITFTALEYSNPDKNRYAYSWGKHPEEWVDLGSENSITFARMQPGRYTLNVRGSSSDGVWNEQAARFAIQVMPPFWQSWWFRLIIILVLLMTAVLLHRTRMRRLAARLRRKSEISDFCRQYKVSSREEEVLFLLLDGLNRPRIAERLYISDATVKNHIYSLYRKLSIRNRAQLFKMFSSLGR